MTGARYLEAVISLAWWNVRIDSAGLDPNADFLGHR